jgi:hypothetical protein
MRRSLLFSVILSIPILNLSSAYSLENVVTNFKFLKTGCYVFTDKFESAENNEVRYSSPVLTNAPMPDSFGGKSAKVVKCTEPHHLEIAYANTSRAKQSLRLDGIQLKSQCIIENIRLLNSGHSIHTAQTYFQIFRDSSGSNNLAICGVLAPNSPNPLNPSFKFFEPFDSQHLKLGKV